MPMRMLMERLVPWLQSCTFAACIVGAMIATTPFALMVCVSSGIKIGVIFWAALTFVLIPVGWYRTRAIRTQQAPRPIRRSVHGSRTRMAIGAGGVLVLLAHGTAVALGINSLVAGFVTFAAGVALVLALRRTDRSTTEHAP
jgi:hypothetical protein